MKGGTAMALYLEVEGLEKLGQDAKDILSHVEALKELTRKIGYNGVGKIVVRLDGDTAKEERK